MPSAIAAILSLVILGLTAAPAQADDIVSDGPLTQIGIHETLNCTVYHEADLYTEFYGDTACGTFVATGGTLFGPSYIPAGGMLGYYTFFTPVSQTDVQGFGTVAQPYTIKTVVELTDTTLRLTEVDSYVIGQESYRTDITIKNTSGGASHQLILYRAGDCYLQDSDVGFGSYDPSSGGVACVAGAYDANGVWGPGDRIEQWLPLSPGSDYIEAYYSDVWAAIATQQPFPNTDRADEAVDNGAGLSWTVTVPPNDSVTRSHLTTFSPQGQLPLTLMKTADQLEAEPGGIDGYTVSVSNPNVEMVSIETITDFLPEGFAYRAGSTSGSILTDPQIDGGTLTWQGPFSVPGQSSISFHFAVDVSSQPGEYFNTAVAYAPSYVVAPAEETAEIDVGGPGLRSVSLEVNKTSVAKGRKVAFFGSITGDGSCIAGQDVDIRAKKTGSSKFKNVAGPISDETGYFFIKVKVSATATYKAVAPPTATCKIASSDPIKVVAH